MSLLTIGLPVYNAMPFLPETIESLLNQTQSNFKILIIDDGSTDESLKYLNTLRDNRIEIISQPNQGITATLNRVLNEVDTPWLVRHDADDIAYPNRLETILQAIHQHEDAGMFYSYAKYHQEGKSFGTFKTTKGSPEVLRNLTCAGYLLSICHPSTTLNVQKVKALGGYRFNLHVEDIDLWWRMALSHDIHLIPQETIGFRLNQSSASSKNIESQMINILYVQYLLLSQLWKNTPLPYESVRASLVKLLDRKRLSFRQNIRATNISLGQKHYFSACFLLLKTLITVPDYFIERLTHEGNSQVISVTGEDPKQFASHCDLLWL